MSSCRRASQFCKRVQFSIRLAGSILCEVRASAYWRATSRPDRAGTAAAVLLGEREEVDRDTNEAYLETGTVHILVVAGLHVGILAWLLFKAIRMGWMSRRTALASVMVVTGIYMLLTGAGPSVIRATLLVWIVCGALWLGRSRIGLNSLAFAGLVLLILNPTNLFQTGVQLSFLSVAALMWAAMHFSDRPQLDPLDRLIRQTAPLAAANWLALRPAFARSVSCGRFVVACDYAADDGAVSSVLAGWR